MISPDIDLSKVIAVRLDGEWTRIALKSLKVKGVDSTSSPIHTTDFGDRYYYDDARATFQAYLPHPIETPCEVCCPLSAIVAVALP